MHAFSPTIIKAIHEWDTSTDMSTAPVFNNLIEYNPETPDPDDLRGDIAKSWTLSDGGTTYTFKLNENAVWHDGVSVTAADVIFSLHSILDNKSVVDSAGNTPLAKQGRGAMVIRLKAYANWKGCCRAIDKSTVEVKLKFPAAAFLPTLALSTMHIMAKHTVLDQGKIQTFETPEEFNGSGPYKLTEVVTDSSNEYVKNNAYWKPGFPRFDGMQHFVIVDGAATVAAFLTGQVLMGNSAAHNMSIRQQRQLAEDMKGVLTLAGC